MRTIAALAVAGCSIAVLAACTADNPRTVAPAPSTAPAAPETTEPTSSAPAPEASASGSGAGGATPGSPRTRWKTADLVKAAYPEMECLPDAGPDVNEDDVEELTVTYGDLTGDGRSEAVVTAACPTRTSTNRVHVFVFDGNRTTTTPVRRLHSSGGRTPFRVVKLNITGRILTIDATALSEKAALCCADLRIVERHRFSGIKSEMISRSVRPL